MVRPLLGCALLCLALSCSDSTAPKLEDGGVVPRQPTSAELFGAGIKKVVLEVDYAAGAEPYTGTSGFGSGDTWDLFKVNAQKLFEGQGKTLEIPTALSQMEALSDATSADFTGDQILALAQKHRGTLSNGETASYYVLWLGGYFKDDSGTRKDVLGVSLGTTGVIAMFKPVIDSTKSTLFPNAPRTVEQSTLVHEFGHAVGLVNNGVALTASHQDTAHGAHCTNTKCVMYWANEGPSGVSDFVQQYVGSNATVLFGAECLDDVAAIRK